MVTNPLELNPNKFLNCKCKKFTNVKFCESYKNCADYKYYYGYLENVEYTYTYSYSFSYKYKYKKIKK